MIFDLEYLNNDHLFIAGIDEVGRGPLAGPVVSATAELSFGEMTDSKLLSALLEKLEAQGVTDSKKLTDKKRAKLLSELEIDVESVTPGQKLLILEDNNCKLHFSISEISHTLIDEMNILNASLLSMEESFKVCRSSDSGAVLIDGNKIPGGMPQSCDLHAIVKGDSKSVLIGLASVIAKEYRDRLMVKLGEKYPGYGLEKHAGYPTKAHKEAIEKLGVTPIHRRSFKGVKEFC